MYLNWDTFISLLSDSILSLCCYHSPAQCVKGLYDAVGCSRENKAHPPWQSTPVFYSCPIVCPSLWFLALHSHFFSVTNILAPALPWLIFSPAVTYVCRVCVAMNSFHHLHTSEHWQQSHSLQENAVNSLHPKLRKWNASNMNCV